MKKKITCWSCGQVVDLERFCTCGAELLAPRQITGENAFANRAGQMEEDFGRMELVRIQIIRTPDDGSPPAIQKIRVTNGVRLFKYSSSDARPVLIPERDAPWTPEEIFKNDGINARIQTKGAGNWCCFCWVKEQTMTPIFYLPDTLSIQEMSTVGSEGLPVGAVKDALKSLSIVSSDDFFGGVSIQASLVCVNHERVMEGAIHSLLEKVGAVMNDTAKVEKQLEQSALASRTLFEKTRDWVFSLVGKKPRGDVQLETFNFNLWHLYQSIHLEVKDAVRNAVRGISAKQLYEDAEERKKVEKSIEKFLGATLSHYGFRLDRIASFRFYCPDYENQRAVDGQIAMERQRLDARKKQQEINEADSDLERAARKREIERLAQLERLTLEEKISTEEVANRAKLQETNAEIQRREAEEASRRAATDAESRQKLALEFETKKADVEIQKEKMENWTKHYREKKEIDNKSLLEAANALKGIDIRLAQLLALRENPELASMWVQAQKAQAFENQVTMLRDVQKQVIDVYGEKGKELKDLMEAVINGLARSGRQLPNDDRSPGGGDAKAQSSGR